MLCNVCLEEREKNWVIFSLLDSSTAPMLALKLSKKKMLKVVIFVQNPKMREMGKLKDGKSHFCTRSAEFSHPSAGATVLAVSTFVFIFQAKRRQHDSRSHLQSQWMGWLENWKLTQKFSMQHERTFPLRFCIILTPKLPLSALCVLSTFLISLLLHFAPSLILRQASTFPTAPTPSSLITARRERERKVIVQSELSRVSRRDFTQSTYRSETKEDENKV